MQQDRFPRRATSALFLFLAAAAAVPSQAAGQMPGQSSPVGNYVVVGNGVIEPGDQGAPALAVERDGGSYFVAWEERTSATDVDLHARRVDAQGQALGSILIIEDLPAEARQPKVAFVRGAGALGAFVVAWEEIAAWDPSLTKSGRSAFEPTASLPSRIVARSYDLATGTLSARTIVAPSAFAQTQLELGGRNGVGEDGLVAVWHEDGLGIVRCDLTVDANPALALQPGVAAPVFADMAGTSHHDPAISHSDGDHGRFLVVCRSSNGGGPGPVLGRILNGDGSLATAVFDISTDGPVANDLFPACDGDGRLFVIAWQREEVLSPGDHDIYVRSLTFDGGTLVKRPVAGWVDAADDEGPPALAYTGHDFVIAFSDKVGGEADVQTMSFDPYTCDVCVYPQVIARRFAYYDRAPVIAAAFSGGSAAGADEDYLVMWESYEFASGTSDVLGRRGVEPVGTVELGGACGTGGQALAPCPRANNAKFTPRLEGAPPFSPAVLFVSPLQASQACGPCIFWPALGPGTQVLPTVTDAQGSASLNVPIPLSALWTPFTMQWLVPNAGGGCGLFGGFDLSNGIEVSPTR